MNHDNRRISILCQKLSPDPFLFLDGGTSASLVQVNPQNDQQTVIKGSKNDGWPYYINTYLLFECEKPRN
jgi:hypothetical protein